MSLVHQPIQLAAAKPELQPELGAERPRMAPQGPHGDVLDPPALDEGNEVLADARPLADVDLSPAEPVPERPEARPETRVVHGTRIVDAPRRPLICHVPAPRPRTVGGMIETTWQRLAALRLERQHLETRAPLDAMLDVVRDHVAVQAQVIGSAELAIHARIDGLRRGDVATALWRDRTLVKTWAMRGTLHLVASDELPELVAALGTRINWLRPVWLRYFRVTKDEMLALQDAIGEVLTGEPMTRTALAQALADRLGDDAFADRVTSGWGTFLKPAASRGLLCFGPDDGRNVTFVDPRAWLGREMPQPSEDAIGAVIERHLAAFPGCSKGELARWWGVQGGAPLRKPIASLGDRVVEVAAADTKVLVRRADLEMLDHVDPSTSVRLLPAFDPYTLSLEKQAEPLLPLARRPLVSRTAGWISQVVLVGGAVAGTWTHAVKKDRLAIEVAPWRRLTAAEQRGIDKEAARIGAFLGAEPEVAIGEPV